MEDKSELFYRLIKIIAILLIASGVANLSRLIFWLSNSHTTLVTVIVFIPLYLITLKNKLPQSRSYFLISFIPLFLLGFWSYFIGEFGTFDWSSIVFHFSAGLGDSGTVNIYIQKALNAGLAVLCISIGMLIMKNYINWFARFDKILAVIILVANPAVVSAAINFISPENDKINDLLFNNYSSPKVVAVKNNNPKNFIHIFLESTEATYKNESVFGNIMQPLRFYEKQGFSAEQLLQVKDTGWSAAGITASYCGVPLSPLGLATGNHFGTVKSFMPQAKCLGDILTKDGYNLSYISGADIESAAFDKILGEHGFNDLIDFKELLKRYPDDAKSIIKDGRTSFGSNDDIAFTAAYEILEKNKALDQPFGITIMTNGGHAPLGNFSASCNNKQQIDASATSSLKAIHCTNLLTQDFIETATANGLLENTVIIVQSDHYAMRNEVFSKIINQDRSNLFFIYGSDINQNINSKPATMFDVYPTILEAIGYSLKNNQAGLGISLLSGKPTMLEDHGLESLNKMIKNDGKLRYTLWADETNNLAKYIVTNDKN